MTQARRDRPAWPLFLIILLLGICFMLAAGQVAIRLVPTWSLIADVDSKINPNDQLAAWNGSAPIEPVSAAILTQPAWRATYLTPGASIFVPPIVQGIPTSTTESNNTPAATQGPGASSTPGQPTAASSSTPVIIIIFPSSTSVPPTKVSTKIPTAAPTTTPTGTSTATVTVTATNTATVTVTATDKPTVTATVTETATIPPINFGPPDGIVDNPPDGSVLTYCSLSPMITDHGDGGYDFVYYELPAAPGIRMDQVIIEIGDGTNWYQVFNWGDDLPDNNSNLVIGGSETDNRPINAGSLINGTGVGIDIYSLGLTGSYPCLRITAPIGGDGDGIDIDAIEIYP